MDITLNPSDKSKIKLLDEKDIKATLTRRNSKHQLTDRRISGINLGKQTQFNLSETVATTSSISTQSTTKEKVERLNLKHRIPLFIYNDNVVSEIKEEIASLSTDDSNTVERFFLFFAIYYKPLLKGDNLKIINYLEGSIALEEIGLTRENGPRFLKLAKLVDLALKKQTIISRSRILFKNSTYEIRTKILELCSPEMQTVEAYTMTPDPKKLKNVDYLRNPANWMPERIRLYAQLILPTEFVRLTALSKRFNHKEHRVYALRGNAGAGKSSIADKIFQEVLDENGKLSGSLSVDNIKFILRANKFSNMQVHEEAARGPLSLYLKDVLNRKKGSIILDARNSSDEDFDKLVAAAQKRQGALSMIDLDTSPLTSLTRVLARNLKENAPCVHPRAVLEGFQETRKRSKLLGRVKKYPCIDDYRLLHTDEQGALRAVARKHGNVFEVFSEGLLKTCCRLPTPEEIESQINQVISSEYAEKVRGVIPDRSRSELMHWKGAPLLQAAEKHAMSIPSQVALEQIKEEAASKAKYGEVTIQPFTGTWLNDYPQIKDHLDSEHLLHVRSPGLHWQGNKFAWKLNPRFNPEATVGNASRGGFQMKLGYFVVPAAQIDKFTSPSLSPGVLRELEVKNESGKLMGYRFFVHPEAYTHFKALHDARIPFVKPEQSEFMGTPTSSYRSWAIRRVLEKDGDYEPQPKTVPFIIKLGVANSSTDSSRLLPRTAIEKSIQAQIGFDKMEKNLFKKGAIGSDLLFFPESLGLVLKGISNYPPCPPCQLEAVDSGIIVREFPKELLEGSCKIFSFSAVMSVERVKAKNQGVCALNEKEANGLEPLPLIYEVMDAAIRKGLVKTSLEFIQKYLIEGYLQAIEPIAFQKGFSLPLHGQNLCIALNKDNSPLGFVIRDFEELNKIRGYIEMYSWFYRYHVFVKLLNVITFFANTDQMPAPLGAPFQIGYETRLPERNLNRYLIRKLSKGGAINAIALKRLWALKLPFRDYNELLKILDRNYVSAISRYFDIGKAGILMKDGTLPAAEIGSVDRGMSKFNKALWEHRLPEANLKSTSATAAKDRLERW